MSAQSYWLILAAASGAVGGVSTDIAYNRFVPLQQAQAAQPSIQPALDQLHADLTALRGEVTNSTKDQAGTLRSMWQIMAKAESDREALQARAQADRNGLHAEADGMRQQALRAVHP